jgi:predicted transcriptional regulator
MTAKAEMLQAIDSMPDDASYEEIAQQIEFIAKVKRGRIQAQRGEGAPLEDVLKQIPQWVTK